MYSTRDRFRQQKEADAEEMPALWVSSDKVPQKTAAYLLPGRIVAASLAIVEGDSNAGKSTFLAHLVASVTTGRPWLGRPEQPPGNVLWCNAEEDAGTYIRPRLQACGADESRVHFPELDDDGQRRRIVLPGCLAQLRQAIDQLSLSLIIIEPLESHVGPDYSLTLGKPSRQICDPLNRLGITTGCTIIITRGLKKDRTGPRTKHGYGHAEMILCSRSCLLIDYPDQLAPTRYLRVVKCAGSRSTPTVSYTLSAGDGPPLMVDMREVGSKEDADDALATDPVDRDVRSDARAMVASRCTTEWVRVKYIFADGKAEGISEKALRRARIDLGLSTRQQADGDGSYHEWGPAPTHIPARKRKAPAKRACGYVGRKKTEKKPKIEESENPT